MSKTKFTSKFSAIVLLSSLFFSVSVYGQGFQEGIDYLVLDGQAEIQSDGRVEVIEFFWFGCPACFQFEPYLHAWNKPSTVNFKTVPATGARNWQFHAHVYYAMELLNQKDQLMSKFYDELHVNRSRILSVDPLRLWLEQQEGVDVDKFAQTLNSFGVITKVAQAGLLGRNYGVSSTPTLIIGKKYKTSPGLAQSEARTLQVVEFLVNKVLSENS